MDVEQFSKLAAPILSRWEKEFLHEQKHFLAETVLNRKQFYSHEAMPPPVAEDVTKVFGITEEEWQRTFSKGQAKAEKYWTYQSDTRPCTEIAVVDHKGNAAKRCTQQERALILRVITANLVSAKSVLNVEYLQGLIYSMETGKTLEQRIPTHVPYAPIAQDLLNTLGLDSRKDYHLVVEDFTALPLWLQACFVYVLYSAAIRLRDGEAVDRVSWRLLQAHYCLRTSLPIRLKLLQLQTLFAPAYEPLMNPLGRREWKDVLFQFMQLVNLWLMFTKWHLHLPTVYGLRHPERAGGSEATQLALLPPAAGTQLVSALAVQNANAVAASTGQISAVRAIPNAEVIASPQLSAIRVLTNPNSVAILGSARFGPQESRYKVSLRALTAKLTERFQEWEQLTQRSQTYEQHLQVEAEAVLQTTSLNLDFLHKNLLGGGDPRLTISFLRTVIQAQLVRNPAFVLAVLEVRQPVYSAILRATLADFNRLVRPSMSATELSFATAPGGDDAILTEDYWKSTVDFTFRNFTAFFSDQLVATTQAQADFLYTTSVILQAEQSSIDLLAMLTEMDKEIRGMVINTPNDAALKDSLLGQVRQLQKLHRPDDSRPRLLKSLFQLHWLKRRLLDDSTLKQLLDNSKLTPQEKEGIVRTQLQNSIFSKALDDWNSRIATSRITVSYAPEERDALINQLVAARVWEDSGYFDRALIFGVNLNTRFQWFGKNLFNDWGLGAAFVAFGFSPSATVTTAANIGTWIFSAFTSLFGLRWAYRKIRGT